MANPPGECDPAKVYLMFNNYNFLEDSTFQEGWSKIVKSIPSEADVAEKLLQSKLFYFGRLHKVRLSLLDYEDWLSKDVPRRASPNENSQQACGSKPCAEDIVCDGMHRMSVNDRLCDDCKVSQREELRPAFPAVMNSDTFQREIDTVKNDRSDMCLSTVEEKPDRPSCCESSGNSVTYNSDTQILNKDDNLTFEQIVELIQSGESIPGTHELNIQPTNQTPTKSSLERVTKPWNT